MSTMTAVALDPDRLYEIVDGQPEEKEIPGARHSGICARLTMKLGIYLAANHVGELYVEGSFQIGANELVAKFCHLGFSDFKQSNPKIHHQN